MNKITFVPPLNTIILIFLIVLINLLSVNKVIAQKYVKESIPYKNIKSGSLYFKSNEGFYPTLIQKSDYQVNVNGLLASVNFTQTFKNSSDEFLEAVYVFPLIDDASVSSMVMEIGERRIVGKIREKQHARKLYTTAKIQGKKVSLVSEERPNLFTTEIANIAPGETIKISLSYLQSVSLSEETFSLRIPLTLTPRFIPSPHKASNEDYSNSDLKSMQQQIEIKGNGWAVNNNRVLDANRITPFQIDDKAFRNNENKDRYQRVSLSIALESGIPITNVHSLYHQIVQTPLINQLLVSLADKSSVLGQDFVLKWNLAQGNVPKAAFFEQSGIKKTESDYQYGLLMLVPPKASKAHTINKEVVYIIDTSGSMGGVAIRQAKQSLITALDLLSPEDTFNVIAFNDSTESLFISVEHASTMKIEQAKYWVSNLNAGGGTNMYPAIEKALHASKIESIHRQVIFITDGSVGNEDELLRLIDRKLADTRLHTIGIGSAPNGYFMSQAAKVGRGTYRYIGNINEVNEQMTTLFNQINKPLMQSVSVTWPIEQVEMFPQKIPDLYMGQPLVISARWLKKDNLSTKQGIIISGKLASKTWEDQLIISNHLNTMSESTNDKDLIDNGVAQWWAKEKIDHLLLKQRRSAKQKKESLKVQITELALKHHLTSPYTSFIAIEEKITRQETKPLKTKVIKNLMPKGSTQIVPMANTSLGLVGYFYLSILLFTVAMIIKLVSTLCFTNHEHI
jgi:Ca-activated chloride channel family protein